MFGRAVSSWDRIVFVHRVRLRWIIGVSCAKMRNGYVGTPMTPSRRRDWRWSILFIMSPVVSLSVFVSIIRMNVWTGTSVKLIYRIGVRRRRIVIVELLQSIWLAATSRGISRIVHVGGV
jgi:hypothetical protein